MSRVAHPMRLRSRASQIAALPAFKVTSGHRRKSLARQPLTSVNAPFVAARLPTEIWLMITDNFPNIEPLVIMSTHDLLPMEFRARLDALRALSQTSRAMRELFLPLLWEEVATCIQGDVPVSADKFLAYVLRQHCLGLLKTPDLAAHVTTMTVSLTRHPAHPSLKPFAKCLASLCNLCYLRIISCTFKRPDLASEFEKRCYPQILSIILPGNIYPILQAFPNVREVICKGPCHDGVLGIIPKKCHKIEAIIGVPPCSQEAADLLGQSAPELYNIGLVVSLQFDFFSSVGDVAMQRTIKISQISTLSSLPGLSELVLQVVPDFDTKGTRLDPYLGSIRAAGMKALQRQTHGKQKTLLIRVLGIPEKDERHDVS